MSAAREVPFDDRNLWVDVTLRLPQDEAVHPDIVRDDLLEALTVLSWSNVASATVTDTSPGYMEAVDGRP